MHPGPPLIACGKGGVKRGVRVPTSDPHTINACWSLFLLSVYLLVAEAASFDKKELCRSDTPAKGVKWLQCEVAGNGSRWFSGAGTGNHKLPKYAFMISIINRQDQVHPTTNLSTNWS